MGRYIVRLYAWVFDGVKWVGSVIFRTVHYSNDCCKTSMDKSSYNYNVHNTTVVYMYVLGMFIGR